VKLRSQQSQWDELGRTDPLWAILTEPGRENGGWTDAEFFATGEREVAGLTERCAALGLPRGHAAALDFGCGVGRVTQSLAPHFDHVTGVDIAPAMLETARRYNRYGLRVRYLLNDEDHLRVFADGSFDLVYSRITLQHVPPRFIRVYLDELVRVLRPGGLLVFQLPEGYRRLADRLRNGAYGLFARRILGSARVMEMYGIPRAEVVAQLESRGARVIEVEEDPIAGEQWLSYRYYVTRPEGT
jgi:SAM-dependent methyltransferase